MKMNIKKLSLIAMFLLVPNYVEGAYKGIVENDVSGNTKEINGENLETGSESGNTAVLYAKDGGIIKMTGGSLTSYNVESVGAATAMNNGEIYLEDVAISTEPGTNGNKKTGLWTASGGIIKMKGGSIKTSQYDSYGATASGNSTIELTNVSIETSGGNAMGIRAAGTNAKVTMNGGSITLTGSGAGDTLNSGVYVGSGAIVGLNNASVTTTGDYAMGASSAFDDASLTIQGGQIITKGSYSYGIYTRGDATSNLYSTALQTEGNNSYGVLSYDDSHVNINNSTVLTKGNNSHGLVAQQSEIIMNGGRVETRGDNAYGAVSIAVSGGAGDLTLENTTIETHGSGSHAVYSQDQSYIHLNGGNIQVDSSLGANAIYTSGTGDVSGVGTYRIFGDIANRDNGNIDLNLQYSSYIKGASDIGSGTINFNLQDSADWQMTKDSTLSTLSFSNGGNIHYDTDLSSGFGTLTVQDLSGDSGMLHMRTDIVGDGLGNNAGDLFVVEGTSQGDHFLHVYNQGSEVTDGSELLTVVETADGMATFDLANKVELGGYAYGIRRTEADDTDWELYSTGEASSTTDAGVNLFSGSYLLNYAETQTLLKRLGDLRGGTQEKGIWARVYGGKFSSGSDGFLHGFDMNYWGVQAGYDKKIEREDKKGVVYVGGFLGYSKGNLDYLGNGSGSIDSKSLGAYWTHIYHNGFYADAVLKYNWMNNDFKHLDSEGTSIKGDDINTQGFTGSLEVGRRYFFDKTGENGEKLKAKDRQGWYVEPQVQLSVGQQNGGHFTASNGLRIKADSYRSVMGRAEVHLGYEVKDGKNPVNVYGKLGVVKEFDGDMDYYLNGNHESTSYGDTWKLWGIGITAQFSQKHNLYLEIERATGGQFTQNWGVNGGYRFSW